MQTFTDCARQLRAQGYNHTHANRYAKLNGKRSLLWASIIGAAETGFSIALDKSA